MRKLGNELRYKQMAAEQGLDTKVARAPVTSTRGGVQCGMEFGCISVKTLVRVRQTKYQIHLNNT
jgi:hypothetical protein